MNSPNLWASLWVFGTAPWLFLHWGTKRGGEQDTRSQRSHFCYFYVFFFFTIKLGSNLQCIQGLSTPPWLPLHIHYVWLQLHHFLFQLTHLNLETATRFSLIETHINTLYAHMHREKKSNLPDHSWQQFAPSLSTHPAVCLMLKNVRRH